MAHRPRPSILSLFDPLSVPSVADKENDLGERSFFHAHSSQTPAQRILRQRLIDIGDITADELDIHDLMAMEDELEEINRNIIDNEDGDTLTWRDMAKAATPKWSGRHVTAFTTPTASPTPRTPLAELSFKEQITPMARKKSYRKHILPMSSNLTSVESSPNSPLELEADCLSIDKSDSTLRHNKTPSVHVPDIITPVIEISDTDTDSPAQTNSCVPQALASSICTLDLPASPENLIADSSFPLDVSPPPSQLCPSPSVLLCIPPSEVRLRPNAASPSNVNNRMSVDLHSSFQLHLNSLDTTFDLLNEKISFLSSTCEESDSFLNTIDDSFGEEDLDPTSPTQLELPKVGVDKPARPNRVFIQSAELYTVEKPPVSSITSTPSLNDHDILHGASLKNDEKSHSKSNVFSHQEKESIHLSTPSTSKYPSLANPPPPPVPGLKIVKRSKLLTRRLSTASNTNSALSSGAGGSTTPSRRASDAARTVLPLGREKSAASIPPLPASNSSRTVKVSQAVPVPVPLARKGTLTSASNTIAGGGPRRVLISEGPKLNNAHSSKAGMSADTSRPPVAANGPRRVAAVHTVAGSVEKVATAIKSAVSSQSNTGLRQPVKYGTVGPSSAIPKPVTRTASSRLPAPATGSRSRPGLAGGTSSGAQARRVT